MNRILIVDGQGGGVGRQLVENIKKEFSDYCCRNKRHGNAVDVKGRS